MEESKKQPSPLQEKLSWYLTILVLALTIIIPPLLCGLFYLSQVPDITWQRSDGLTSDRIWMYQERRPLGIAYQGRRVIWEYSPTEVCVETRLRFWLWGKSRLVEPATSSQKMILVDHKWQATGQRC